MKHTMRSNRIEILSPLSPAECASRLRTAIDLQRSGFFSWTAFLGSKPVIGWVTQTSLRLSKRISYNNAWQTCFTGSMEPHSGGTRISGRFDVGQIVRIFMYCWFTFASLPFLSAICRLLFGRGESRDGFLGVVVAAVITIAVSGVGTAFFGFGRYLARDEAHDITDFLMATLNGRDVSLPD